MNARDSVENYDSRIREYANYSFRQSRKVCKSIGAREAGSEKEKELALVVKNELESCADDVQMQQFTFQKDTKIAQNKVGAIFIIFAFALLLSSALFSVAVLSAASACVAVLGVVLSFAGSVYVPKKLTSQNVYSIKKPSGEVKNRILFLSNTDCIKTSKFNSSFLKVMMVISAVIIAAVSAMFFVLGENIKDTETVNLKYLLIPAAAFIIFDVIILFSSYTGILDGANKNLSGIFTSIAVLKYLQDMKLSLSNTQIEILVTGANEANTSGSKFFLKNNPQILNKDNTKIICLDCLREEKDLRIETKNVSSSLSDELKQAAKESGFEIEARNNSYKNASEVFEKAGYESCAITACPKDFEIKEDTYEDMKILTIEKALKTIMQEVFFVDENPNK